MQTDLNISWEGRRPRGRALTKSKGAERTFRGHKRVREEGESSVWPLLERARVLRRDTARLLRRLRKTSDEISARDPKATVDRKPDVPVIPNDKTQSRAQSGTDAATG